MPNDAIELAELIQYAVKGGFIAQNKLGGLRIGKMKVNEITRGADKGKFKANVELILWFPKEDA